MSAATWLAFAGLVATSCGFPARTPTSAGDSDLAAARERLALVRGERPTSPWAAGVHALVRQPRGGRTFEGRGAIAVAPGRAVRVVLFGPVGATAFDLWITRDRFRLLAPAFGLARKGSGGAEDLPIGFLRWWWIAPLDGKLVETEHGPAGEQWLLRTGEATVQLGAAPCARGHGWLATRRSHHVERVLECRARREPSVGDFVTYDDLTAGFHVELSLESVSDGPPDEQAFQDPDTLAEPAP